MSFLQKLFPTYRGEEKLLHDEELFTILNNQTILALTDLNGVIVEVNDNFCNLSQFSREELIGKTHKVVNSGFHSRKFWEFFWETLKRGEIWSGVICNRTKDQSYYWVKSTVGPIRDQSGKIIYYLALRGEISKWRESRIKSDRDQYLLSEASKLAKVGGWELDLNTNKLFWSEYTRKIYEVDDNFIPNVEKAISFYKEGWSQEKIKDALKRCLAEGTEWNEELIILTAHGNEKWVRSKGFPVYEEGHIVRIHGTFQDIDEEKAKALETEKAFGLLKNVLNASIEYALIATDLNGVVTTFNRGAERLLGYSAEEIIFKKTPVLWHLQSEVEERGKILSERLGELIQGFRVFVTMAEINEFEESEWTYIKKNGDHVPVSLTVTTVKNERGDVIGYLGVASDLTQKNAMLQRVEESRRKFQGAFEQSGIGMAIVGLNGEWIEVNNTLCDMLQYSSNELLSLTFQEITHPEDLKSDLELLKATIDGEQKSYRMEKRYIRKDGKIVWVNLNISLVRDTAEEPLYFVSQIEDITRQKTLQAELEDSENRLSLATRTAKVGIWDWDLKEELLVWDDTMFELYGLKKESNHITIEDWGKLVHPDDFDEVDLRLQEVLKKGELYETTFRIIRPNGDIRHIKAQAIVRRDNISPVRMVGTNQDITESVTRELRLKELAEQAKQASEAKGQFLANMSHEIRTPINGITGMTSLLLDMDDLTHDQREHVGIIDSSSQALMSLINDILDFSKVEAGKLELEHLQFSLRHTLEEFTMILALRANQKGLTFLCSADSDVPDTLIGDPGRLRQILLNLAGNAIKFTSHGKVEVRVQREPQTTDSKKEKLRFIVSDTGIGISQHAQATIFEEFSQADASTTRSFGGTGLGLAISKQLSSLMNGEIGVQSELKKGSQFWFTAEFELSEVQQPQAIEGLDNAKVLIIQPDVSVSGFIEHQFKIWNVHTRVCRNLEEVEELIQQEKGELPYAYVLTDEQIDASRLSSLLTPYQEKVKVILCAQLGYSFSGQKLAQLGFASVVHKPIRQSELYNSFRSIVGASEDHHIQLRDLNANRFQNRPNRILLVEDNPVNQLVAKGLLEKFGMRVQCASDGNEAIDLIQSMKFDIALMDVQMPIMDGITATQTIRTALPKPARDIPIIALTAHARVDDKKECLDAGMDDYLSKPIVARRLYELLDEYLPEPATGTWEKLPRSSMDTPINTQMPLDTFSIFSPETLLEIVLDDLALAKMIANQVIQDLKDLIEPLEKSIGKKDAASAATTLHTIKGVCSNAGANRLRQESLNLELMAKNGDEESLRATIPAYKELLFATVKELEAFIS